MYFWFVYKVLKKRRAKSKQQNSSVFKSRVPFQDHSAAFSSPLKTNKKPASRRFNIHSIQCTLSYGAWAGVRIHGIMCSRHSLSFLLAVLGEWHCFQVSRFLVSAQDQRLRTQFLEAGGMDLHPVFLPYQLCDWAGCLATSLSLTCFLGDSPPEGAQARILWDKVCKALSAAPAPWHVLRSGWWCRCCDLCCGCILILSLSSPPPDAGVTRGYLGTRCPSWWTESRSRCHHSRRLCTAVPVTLCRPPTPECRLCCPKGLGPAGGAGHGSSSCRTRGPAPLQVERRRPRASLDSVKPGAPGARRL